MNKYKKKILFTILCGAIVVVMAINFFNNKDFLTMPIGTGLTLITTLVVCYYFTQTKQDERIKKEIYLHLLEDLQRLVTEECLYKITTDSDISKLLMMKRKLNNSTNVLKEKSADFGLDNEMSFIEEKVKEYTDLFGEHQGDLDYLTKSEKELERPLDLIEQKISESKLKLFD